MAAWKKQAWTGWSNWSASEAWWSSGSDQSWWVSSDDAWWSYRAWQASSDSMPFPDDSSVSVARFDDVPWRRDRTESNVRLSDIVEVSSDDPEYDTDESDEEDDTVAETAEPAGNEPSDALVAFLEPKPKQAPMALPQEKKLPRAPTAKLPPPILLSLEERKTRIVRGDGTEMVDTHGESVELIYRQGLGGGGTQHSIKRTRFSQSSIETPAVDA